MNIKLCSADKCYYYSHNSDKYPRKCFYEVQCWRGYFDILVALFKLRFGKGNKDIA